MAKCGACGKFVSGAEGVKCCKCNTVYDRACVALPALGRIVTTWVCPTCTSKLPRDNSSDTPVKGVTSKSSVIEDKPEETYSTTLSLNVHEDLVLQMQLLRKEIVEFRGELAGIRSTLSVYGDRLSALESRISEIEQRSSARELENPKSTDLAALVGKLQTELNDREQELLINDIEVSNLPEDKGENTAHLVTLVASKLGISLDERDVVSAVRIGPHKTVAAGIGGVDGSVERVRPRMLVVRLARRSLRDEFIRSARVRRGATTADKGLQQEPRRFYINERLTKTNRQLFYKAREEGRRLNWRFIWTREGRIYARQDQGKQAHRLRTDSDLVHIFKNKPVGSQVD